MQTRNPGPLARAPGRRRPGPPRHPGAPSAARVPRVHVLLRRAAEAGQPRFLRRLEPGFDPGAAGGGDAQQPGTRADRPAGPPAGGAGRPHRLRRAGRRTGHAGRALGQGRGGRRPGAVLHVVPDGQLPRQPVLHRIGHRLRLRLDATAAGRLGRRALGRRVPAPPRGGAVRAGCAVSYEPGSKLFVCPCHGSEFNGRTGAVITGPAPRGLSRIQVAKGPGGQLYIS
jgi:hypothetical protein